MTASDIHICSLIVHHQPQLCDEVIKEISALPDTSIPYTNKHSKLVVVLEAESERDILDRMTRIATIKGVVSSNLVYQQHEAIDSIDEEMSL